MSLHQDTCSNDWTFDLGLTSQLHTGIERAAATSCAQAAGAYHLLRAAACDRTGCSQLALSHTLTHLVCYAKTAKSEDRCLAYAQAASYVSKRQGHSAAEQVLQCGLLLSSVQNPQHAACLQCVVSCRCHANAV